MVRVNVLVQYALSSIFLDAPMIIILSSFLGGSLFWDIANAIRMARVRQQVVELNLIGFSKYCMFKIQRYQYKLNYQILIFIQFLIINTNNLYCDIKLQSDRNTKQYISLQTPLVINLIFIQISIFKIISEMRLLFFLLAITILSASVNTREIQVPALYDNTPLSLKLGSSKVIKQPDFDFQKVYRRSVQKVNEKSTSRFPACSESKPQVELKVLDQVLFEGIPEKPVVIYKFDDIRYSQFLLDVYYQNLKIYLMFKNGKAAVVTLQSDQRIDSTLMIDVDGYNQGGDEMEIGYFIKVSDKLLFVNNNLVIAVTDKEAKVIEGYGNHTDFESVIALENGYFVVADTPKGITIYKFDGKKVSKSNFYDEELLSPRTELLELMDIIYYKQKQTLFVLDLTNGISSYKVSYTGTGVGLSATQPISKNYGCKLMYEYNSTLYVFCGRMYAYSLEKWPTVEQYRLPFPNIQVKQIYEIDDIVAFVGRNVFSLQYLDRSVNYYQDGNVDKILFHKDLFISASEGGLDIGDINIIKPYINCVTDNQDFLGITPLVFKTTAECNDQYFEKYNVSKSELGEIGHDDVCVYTVYRSVNYWKVGQIKTYPFIGASLAILAIVVIAILIFLVKRLKIRRIQAMIEEYSAVNANSESAKHQELAEEMDAGISSKKTISDKSEDHKNDDHDKKPSEVQLAENMHDIA